MSTPDRLLIPASVADCGWPVIALHHRSKRPIGARWTDPREWLTNSGEVLDADLSDDPWRADDVPNFGAITGEPDGRGLALVLIDQDGAAGEVARLLAEGGPDAERWAAETIRVERGAPDRGHLWGTADAADLPPSFAWHDPDPERGGWEFRAGGGRQTVLPGSWHPSGSHYTITGGVRVLGDRPEGGWWAGIEMTDAGPVSAWVVPLPMPPGLLDAIRRRSTPGSRPAFGMTLHAATLEENFRQGLVSETAYQALKRAALGLDDVPGAYAPMRPVHTGAPAHRAVGGSTASPDAVRRRLDALARKVTEGDPAEGNNLLNWAAGKAAAIVATEPEAPDAAEVCELLVSAFLARPVPRDESLRSREAEARATVASGWRYGTENPAEALVYLDPEALPIVTFTTEPERSAGTVGAEDVTMAPGVDAEAEAKAKKLAAVRERFPLLDIVALVDPNRPPRRWLWDGLIPEGDHASLVAPAGMGKSLLALSLAVAVARGERTFAGRALGLPDGCCCLYLDMENSDDDWSERLLDLGVTPAEAARILGTRFLPMSLPPLPGLDTKRGAVDLLDVIDAYGVGTGDLLVLDSTQRLTEGEENSNDTMRRLYNFTAVELKRRGITVLRTDNMGWDKLRERGASNKRDDVGYTLLLSADDRDEDLLTLKRAKHRARKGTDTGSLTFRRAMTGGRLTFTPERPNKAARFDDARDLLECLGVPCDDGVNKAWEAVTKHKKELMAAGDSDELARLKPVTREVVEKVQTERQASLIVFTDGRRDDD